MQVCINIAYLTTTILHDVIFGIVIGLFVPELSVPVPEVKP
jgi:hypothetical protein